MNDSRPNILEDVFLIISAREQETQGNYMKFVEQVHQSKYLNSDSKIPTYVLVNKRTLMMPTKAYVDQYIK